MGINLARLIAVYPALLLFGAITLFFGYMTFGLFWEGAIGGGIAFAACTLLTGLITLAYLGKINETPIEYTKPG